MIMKAYRAANVLAPRALVYAPSMAYHPKWVPRYRDIYNPTYYDDVHRRWDS